MKLMKEIKKQARDLKKSGKIIKTVKGQKKKEYTAKKPKGSNRSEIVECSESKSTPRKSNEKNNMKIFCIFCDEQYVDPPVEEWIVCHLCSGWCHEEYANVDLKDKVGDFICGECPKG